jgi:hypothetical protein
MAASIRGAKFSGVHVGNVPVPVVFFDDQFAGGPQALSAHSPNIGVPGMSYFYGSDGQVSAGGYLYSTAALPPTSGGYMYGIYGVSGNGFNMTSSTEYEITWSWYSGSSSSPPSYYSTYLLINTNVSPWTQQGFTMNVSGGNIVLEMKGETNASGLTPTISPNTWYTGTLTVTNTSGRLQFLGIDHTIAITSPIAPGQIYVLLSDTTRYDYIHAVTIV